MKIEKLQQKNETAWKERSLVRETPGSRALSKRTQCERDGHLGMRKDPEEMLLGIDLKDLRMGLITSPNIFDQSRDILTGIE